VWQKDEKKGFITTGFAVGPNGQPLTDAMGHPLPPVSYVQEVSNVPIFDRLYLGGSNNLRGFRFRDISPKDSNNQPIGGQSMARATVELTFPIIEKARGAIFYDCGFVNPDAWDFSPGDITIPRGNSAIATELHNRFGVPTGNSANPAPASLVDLVSPRKTVNTFASDFGVGVRLDLPIGPLRLDYGFPIDTAGNGKHGHLNFSVGYQF
jgi:outer membrane protein insertion porin family